MGGGLYIFYDKGKPDFHYKGAAAFAPTIVARHCYPDAAHTTCGRLAPLYTRRLGGHRQHVQIVPRVGTARQEARGDDESIYKVQSVGRDGNCIHTYAQRSTPR